jgi:hypothetical protein
MKTPKLGSVWYPRRSIEATYLPIMRCPVYRRRDSNPGSGMELENRVGDDKGKGTIVSRRGEERHAVWEMRVDPRNRPVAGGFKLP